MSNIPWPDFAATHQSAHLVTATVPYGDPGLLRERQEQLTTFLTRLNPVATYSITTDREPDKRRIDIAFESEPDAERLVAAVQGRDIVPPSGWATARGFVLDDAMAAAIAVAMARDGDFD
jgi:hypothetical protein